MTYFVLYHYRVGPYNKPLTRVQALTVSWTQHFSLSSGSMPVGEWNGAVCSLKSNKTARVNWRAGQRPRLCAPQPFLHRDTTRGYPGDPGVCLRRSAAAHRPLRVADGGLVGGHFEVDIGTRRPWPRHAQRRGHSRTTAQRLD
eukprot:1477187-Rhodomonas_salina.1